MGKVGKGMGFWHEDVSFSSSLCAAKNGFTIHARTKVNALDREGLERLVSYMSRPPIANFRLTKEENGDLRYELKKTLADGTHSILLTPLELIEKLTALIPSPWLNLVVYFGVFSSAHKLRSQLIHDPSYLKNGDNPDEAENDVKKCAYDWAALLKRVFNINIDTCPKCGGQIRFLAAITEAQVIHAILKCIGHSTDPPNRSQRKFYRSDAFAS